MAENSNSSFPQGVPDWQSLYQAALVETDPEKLHQRILLVEEAIYMRSQAIHGSAKDSAERQAIEDAMQTLRVIQVEKLNYPDWKVKK
jgi:hypothetical protein